MAFRHVASGACHACAGGRVPLPCCPWRPQSPGFKHHLSTHPGLQPVTEGSPGFLMNEMEHREHWGAFLCDSFTMPLASHVSGLLGLGSSVSHRQIVLGLRAAPVLPLCPEGPDVGWACGTWLRPQQHIHCASRPQAQTSGAWGRDASSGLHCGLPSVALCPAWGWRPMCWAWVFPKETRGWRQGRQGPETFLPGPPGPAAAPPARPRGILIRGGSSHHLLQPPN